VELAATWASDVDFALHLVADACLLAPRRIIETFKD